MRYKEINLYLQYVMNYLKNRQRIFFYYISFFNFDVPCVSLTTKITHIKII